ncbi:MAG: FAD-binding protein [Candidatus Acididesulfobacter guangdongensis]|uniref:FAD-binding protein n=1 Tax=Acididesulfobacter guangdongensis TaxID=2597225 RepID=A0A519BIH0_ACIG2|nr:MAG: FAD-binding protein [Candidatus Acididesulfobacter guangdongensis]
MDKKLIYTEFKNILGADRVLAEREELLCYSYDATIKESMPDFVVFPLNEVEISAIVKACNKFNIPVVGRGAGSGFSGGSVPISGGAVVSFAKMTNILELDEENMFVTVAPGIINADLKNYLADKGYFYPPDPASFEFCSIGGNVAECAGGPKAVKYGVTKNYVYGLEAITGSGEIINTGSKTIKDVAGYNLTQLLVGSEGTLGLFSKIILKFLPKPETSNLLIVSFDSSIDGFNAALSLLKLNSRPSMLEFMDSSSITAVKNYFKNSFIDIKGDFLFIIEADGSADEVKDAIELYKNRLNKFSPVLLFAAGNEKEKKAIMDARKAISPALRAFGDFKINNDIAVPINKIVQMLGDIKNISDKYNVPIINFGHFGDGNIHVNIMLDKSDATMLERGEKAKYEIMKKTVELGGTISGEHGIGTMKKEFMNLKFDPYYINLMRNIKKSFDPNNILNPGKIFD